LLVELADLPQAKKLEDLGIKDIDKFSRASG
jgi:hypothetical protein